MQSNIIPEVGKVIIYDSINKTDKINALTAASIRLRQKNENLNGQKDFMDALDFSIVQFAIAFHKKIALTFAIIVLFFVGAPLGAIIRKGGFGAPVVIAALLFMVYFILISVGESLAQEQVVSPVLGMWFATLVLAPFAIVFMLAAANDSPVFNKETYSKIWSNFKFRKTKK
jgi:lipopolysaccharide export system permease protein